jgi:hypothetical protein
LIYVLVTCVPNRINKRKTGFSTVRKHIIRHRAVFKVSLRIQLQIFGKPPCAAGALRGFPKIFKLIGKFSISS